MVNLINTKKNIEFCVFVRAGVLKTSMTSSMGMIAAKKESKEESQPSPSSKSIVCLFVVCIYLCEE